MRYGPPSHNPSLVIHVVPAQESLCFANERLKIVSLRAQFSVKLRFLCHYWRSISLLLQFARACARAAVLR